MRAQTTIGILAALLLVLATAPALAQDAPPTTHVVIRVWNQQQTQVIENVTEIGQWTCGQAAVPNPGTVSNPRGVVLDDWTTGAPQNATCRYTPSAGQPLFALPFGPPVYTATAAFRNATGTGPESPASNPFSRPGTPPTAAPAGLRVTP